MSKIISQRTILKDKYIEVIENTIDFNGITKKHTDYYRKPSVSIFPLSESYEVYLIRQYRYLYEKKIVEAVAGMIDEGEDVIEAAQRELKEEAGIVAGEIKKIHSIYVAGSFAKIKQHIVIARSLKFEKAIPEDTEEIELIKVSLEEAVEMVLKSEIITASSIIGILLLDKMRQEGKI